jgi:sugar phosphate isomerase/epimerase
LAIKIKSKKLMNTNTRRNFLKASALTAAATMINPALSSGKSKEAKSEKLRLGLASYTTRKFNQDETIKMAKRAGLDFMCFKSMHLPLDASLADLKAAGKNVRDGGLELVSGGVIYMKSKEQVDQGFEYAKNAGMSLIVGVPNHDLLEYTNEKIKQYDIAVAIHNHGPGDEVYPSPESIYERIKNLDPRMGICMDIGHTQRIGVDPSDAAKKYFDRLHDIHIKDVTKATSEGATVEIGRGVIDIPKFLKTLIDLGYKGVVNFEYEKDQDDPLPGLCESVGYVKGCLAAL